MNPPVSPEGPLGNENGHRVRAAISNGITDVDGRLTTPTARVKREASHFFMLWLKSGVSHCRTLARALSDAARKASP
jgi:hypothetical protein